jgi:ATP-dependent DNA helicase RecG
MNKKELDFILQEGEGFKIEFKESMKHLDKEIVALANASGGRIFAGVDDDGKIKGIKITNELKSQVQDIANNCDPLINIKLSVFNDVLIINVPESSDKPHKCSSGFYLRKGANSQKMKREEIVDFIFSQGKRKFDSLPHKNFKLREVDKNILRDFLKKAGVEEKLPVHGTLFNLGVLHTKRLVNNAGVLFFSKSPKRYFINAYITCARYLGTDKVEILDRVDFEGNLISQVEEAVKFVRRNTRLSYKIKNIQREEIPEYPLEAVREAIVNSVMHRDYFETGAHVQVDIFDNRMVITNIGSLIKPLTKEKLGELAVRRNPLIADLFHRIGYVERMGTGLKRIKKQCQKQNIGVKIETNGFFIITFKLPSGVIEPVTEPLSEPVTEPLNRIIKLIKTKKQVNRKLIMAELRLSRATATRHLSKLKQMNMIKFVGSAKTGHYVLIVKRG